MKSVKYLISIILSICLLGCSESDHDLLQVLKKEIKDRADLAEKDSKGYSTFRLSDITNFQWDKFYVFDQYITDKDIKEITGITWDGDSPSEGEKRILFICKDKIVRYVDFNPADFPLFIYLCGPSDQYKFTKNDDPFGVFKYRDHKQHFWAMVPLRCIKDYEHFYKRKQ